MKKVHCFVAMPFLPELNYFYLYLQHYLAKTYGFEVERGDHSVAVDSILAKIRRRIQLADLVIGDVSGSNPNVLYEMGLADAFGVRMIFVTSDSRDKIPVDIRHREILEYDLQRHVEFLASLDKAIISSLADRYSELYKQALEFLEEFNSETARSHQAASHEQFQRKVMALEGQREIPDGNNRAMHAEFLLLNVLRDPPDPATIKEYSSWLESLNQSPQ